jgi:hypothetical protein
VGTRLVDMTNVGSEMSCLLTILLRESFMVLVVVPGSEGRPLIPVVVVGEVGIECSKVSPRGEMGDG